MWKLTKDLTNSVARHLTELSEPRKYWILGPRKRENIAAKTSLGVGHCYKEMIIRISETEERVERWLGLSIQLSTS